MFHGTIRVGREILGPPEERQSFEESDEEPFGPLGASRGVVVLTFNVESRHADTGDSHCHLQNCSVRTCVRQSERVRETEGQRELQAGRGGQGDRETDAEVRVKARQRERDSPDTVQRPPGS